MKLGDEVMCSDHVVVKMQNTLFLSDFSAPFIIS